MDRLTYWCDNGMGGGEYRVNEKRTEYSGPSVDRLAAYEDAEEQGCLITLPCKVGDTVWARVIYLDGLKVRKANVISFVYNRNGLYVEYEYCAFGPCRGYATFGKTVFLTREEAEAALGGDGDG